MRIRSLEVVSKYSIEPVVKAGATFKPEEYSLYFEDLNFVPNAEIGIEGMF